MTSNAHQNSTAHNNTAGRLSLIFGILGIPLFLFIYFGIPLGVAAIVLGATGIGRANRGEAGNRGQATAGLVCGMIALAATLGHIAYRIVEGLL
ncbi:DUF4190 domain-containing protein [Haloechinothrix sp. LS1_15]|uniref:DUF4190 domain-containing protein n=1 Tax=Haloechinothrix sp. LS1_15 TaxID=2652248 RepID=UPI002944DD37|nr:DUF4190 domain-containing protein [Haloechinothrix sp. LS1_15]MDV6011669.1 DUF4190 domain-containing protein [Haloechinothrix sp. LS1_15]